jgi:hypothetical protein
MQGPARVFLAFSCLVATALGALADDYQCTSDTGCTAMQSTDSGTRTVRFKKGDIVSTSGGWIVNPNEGWSPVD